MYIIKYLLSLLSLAILFSTSACADLAKVEIKSFEDCVSHGYPVMRSYPPKCTAGDGIIFTKEVPKTNLVNNPPAVTSFEECKNAGYLLKPGKPDQCITPEKIVFFSDNLNTNDETQICKNLCGDGECQEIVCMGEGCPCAETSESCKEDCQ